MLPSFLASAAPSFPNPFANLDLAPVMTEFLGHIVGLIGQVLPVVIPVMLAIASVRIVRRFISTFF